MSARGEAPRALGTGEHRGGLRTAPRVLLLRWQRCRGPSAALHVGSPKRGVVPLLTPPVPDILGTLAALAALPPNTLEVAK